MVLMTMHHMDRGIILMMYMGFVMMWTEPGFPDFGLNDGVDDGPTYGLSDECRF